MICISLQVLYSANFRYTLSCFLHFQLQNISTSKGILSEKQEPLPSDSCLLNLISRMKMKKSVGITCIVEITRIIDITYLTCIDAVRASS